MLREQLLIAGCLAFAFLATMSEANADLILTVDGRANIFGAGHTVPPDPAGGGLEPGVMPPLFSFESQPDLILTVTSVTGLASMNGWGPFGGGDGLLLEEGVKNTDIYSHGGISGLLADDRYGPLVGVFLSDAEPSDPAPARLDITGNIDFQSVTPLLNQTFFIGDGRDSNGNTQAFFVPKDATRLFLGFVDGNYDTHQPGYYSDNRGFLTVTLDVSAAPSAAVPEPSSLVVFSSLGVMWLAAAWRRKRR